MVVELKKGYYIESNYDKFTDSYITILKDKDGNQVNDALYSDTMVDRNYDIQEIKDYYNNYLNTKVVKDDIEIDIEDTEEEKISEEPFEEDEEEFSVDELFEESLSEKDAIMLTKKATKKTKLPALSTLSPIMPDGAAGIATFNSGVGLSEAWMSREELIDKIKQLGFKNYKFDKYSDEQLYKIYQDRLKYVNKKKEEKSSIQRARDEAARKKQKDEEREYEVSKDEGSFFKDGIEFESEEAAKDYFGESIMMKEYKMKDNKLYLNILHEAWDIEDNLYDEYGDDPESLRIEQVELDNWAVFSHDGNSAYYFGNSRDECVDWCEDRGERYYFYESKQSNHKNILNESLNSKRNKAKHNFRTITEGLKYFERKEFDENCKDAELELLYEGVKNNLGQDNIKKLGNFLKRADSADDVATFIKSLLNENVKSCDGWIAIYNGNRVEIPKSDANGIYEAKQIAIKKLKVPKSKVGLLAIKPGYNESLTEARKPKFVDTMFGKNVKDAMDRGELTYDNIEEWNRNYNGGNDPIPAFNTRELMNFYYMKPDYFNEDIKNYGKQSPSVDDILDWLSNHDTAWEDCQRHFGLDFDNDDDVLNLDTSSLEEWISEHDGLWLDYCRYFGLNEDTYLNEDINRYSDVVPYEDRKYWYFTTHGIGPGTIPKDLHVLEVREGQNDKGTWGDFVCLDGILNTSELKKYDMIEKAPTDESLTESGFIDAIGNAASSIGSSLSSFTKGLSSNSIGSTLGNIKSGIGSSIDTFTDSLNESYIEEWWGQTDDDPYELESYGLRVIEKDRQADEVLYRFEGRKSDIERAMDDGYFYSFDYGEDAGHSTDLDKTWDKIVDELIEALHTVGFELDSSVSQPVRDNAIEGKHLQVINPSLMFSIDEAEGNEEYAYELMVDDLKDVTYVLDKFEEDNDVSITFSFGPNKDNVITGGIDVRSARHS